MAKRFSIKLYNRETFVLNSLLITEKSAEASYLNLRATKVAMVASLILICFSNTASTGYSLRPLGTMATQYFTGKEVVRALPFKSAFVSRRFFFGKFDSYVANIIELSKKLLE